MAMIQEGPFISNKTASILHIMPGKQAQLNIAENKDSTIAIMQLIISEKTNALSLNSLYSETKFFSNEAHIVCYDNNAIELSYTKIFTLPVKLHAR